MSQKALDAVNAARAQMLDPQTIELDCAPGYPRPGDLIGQVVAGTVLENHPSAKPDSTVSRFFGCWVWSFPDVSPDAWKQIQIVTEPRIKALYRKGLIRYGSW